MAGKDIQRMRAQSALEVIRQHPVLVLFAVSPALALLGLVWWFAGLGWAVAAAVVLALLAGVLIVRG
jgi:predicted lysophospholipase L1 biosynthesis ABC-type transport system permease subunit